MLVFLQFAARGRNDWWRYVLSPVVACLLTVLTLVVVGVAMMLAHLLPPDFAVQMQNPEYVVPFFLGIIASFGLLAVSLLIAVALIHKKRASDVIGEWRWDFFALGFVSWILVQAVLTGIDVLIDPRGFAVSLSNETAKLASVALVSILVQTFSEELIFRGYLTQGLMLAFKRPMPAAIVSGLIFGSVHILNGSAQTLNAVVFGIVCAMIAIRTGGIALTWGLHVANNLFGAVIVVQGNDVFKGSPGIFTQVTPQLMWWDLFLSVVALLAALWLILRRPYFSAVPAG